MDSIGTLEIGWTSGYNGSSAEYIDKSTLCFACGNNIVFLREDGSEKVFPCPGEGVGPLAVHGVNKVFAFAELAVNPKIFVYSYPDFELVNKIKNGAQLEYLKVIFSTSEFLGCVSGVPEFELTVWKYTTGECLCSTSLSHITPNSISFNAANWRQMCITTTDKMFVWNIEQCNTQFLFKKRDAKVPLEDGTELVFDEKEEDDPSGGRSSTRMSRMTVVLPQAAIAGVVGEMAEHFDDYMDLRARVKPVSHVWTPTGDILVGCEKGLLVKVDGETLQAVILHQQTELETKKEKEPRVGRRESTSILKDKTKDQLTTSRRESLGKLPKQVSILSDHNLPEVSSSLTVADCAIQCLALHKNGLYLGGMDGNLRHVEVIKDSWKLLESTLIGEPISSLAYNTQFDHLGIGSSRGTIHVYELNQPEPKLLLDTHYGNIVGMGFLAPGSRHVVTVREDGELQIWDVDSSKLISSMPIGLQATSLVCSPMFHMVCVGSASGHLYVVDATKITEPRVVHREHLHTGPINHLTFDGNGYWLFTGSNDGAVFVIDGRPSKKWEIIGYTTVEGEIQAIGTHTPDKVKDTKVVVTTNTSGHKRQGATRLVHFNITSAMMKDPQLHYATLKNDFKDESIEKLVFNFSSPAYGCAVTAANVIYTIEQNTKKLDKIVLPNEAPKKEFSKDSYLHAVEQTTAHQLPGGRVMMSPHQKWVATAGPDGKVHVRSVGALDRCVEVAPHDYRHGGVAHMAISRDGQTVVSTGYDGVIACFVWNYTASGENKAKSAVEAARAHQANHLIEQQKEDGILSELAEWSLVTFGLKDNVSDSKEDMEDPEKKLSTESVFTTPTPEPESDSTWLETKELYAITEEDKQYSEVKKGLRTEIRDMRVQLQQMMADNLTVPEIEKLGQHEFDLDIDEQTRLQAMADQEVSRIREEIEFEDLAKKYVAEMIKRECWDEMIVKGRSLVAFRAPLEVANYPMHERSEEEIAKLNVVCQRREIEIEELKSRRLLTEITQKPAQLTSSLLDDVYALQPDQGAEEEMNETDDVENEGHENPATSGSSGSKCGGGNPMFYSQFELHTREQKLNQITLLEDAIYRIKQFFNKEFDEVFDKKQQEISRINDRVKRIRKILNDLHLSEVIDERGMTIVEKPERLLTVDDSEVKVEKYYTPEQKKKLEEEHKIEEERRAKEKGDNARERGLDMMMGGVLEIKKEDELKKDVPIPAFMQSKAEDDWTEDEKKAAQEYEKKVILLNEEREKYKKQLEMELKKLQGLIEDSEVAFDEHLKQLFTKKVQTEMVIYQEELKILRLQHALLIEEELDTREKELNRLLEHKREMKVLAAQAVQESKINVDKFRDLYDIMVAEDKVMDKGFKREFHDVPAVQADQLYRLFRKRPRAGKANLRSETPIYDSKSGNPFSERPPTARQAVMSKNFLQQAMVELDKESNMPEGVELHVWHRMCKYRQDKMDSEHTLKLKALVLADMNAFLQKRHEEDDKLKREIANTEEALVKLQDEKFQFTCNTEVQLLLKQGQVEVDPGTWIHDFRDSILINRNVVEDLNGKIKELGQAKIQSMEDSKDFRKGIIQLEWEHKKNLMQLEDLHKRMRDINMMKVTRQIQAYLDEEDHDAKKAQEISILEQTLIMQKTHHERNVEEHKKVIKELRKMTKLKEEENALLETELEGLNVSVNERKHINDVNADKMAESGVEKRYQEIVQRRKLVDLAKAQAQEVAVLRAEVERLRMRTFPALVQVEH